MNTDGTIAAIATPIGRGGIGIIRISGTAAFSIASGLFAEGRGTKKIDDSKVRSHTIHYGRIFDGAHVVDEVMVSFMRAPKTYTKEDIVEINCHGGVRVAAEVLELALKNGARLAEPGEFTKRAYLNGRIDLSQCEAVIDVIDAGTRLARRHALNQLGGSLSKRINELRDEILYVIAGAEAALDFPEYDADPEESGMEAMLCPVLEKIDSLLESASLGKIISDGIEMAIIGKPNVGKSSILNVLAGGERAIVTDIPGTTRDILHETIDICGIPVKLLDTAGIRETNDTIEKIGVERSVAAARSADVILLVLDGSHEPTGEDIALLEMTRGSEPIILLNKRDLGTVSELEMYAGYTKPERVLAVSAKKNMGFEELYESIGRMFGAGELERGGGEIITSARHKAALHGCADALRRALQALGTGLTYDLIAADLAEAYDALGEITGQTLSADIADKIFSEFCVGK